jgi:hypothetical protein
MFLAALALALFFALGPLPDPVGWDKALHMLAFACLTAFGRFSFPRLSVFRLVLLLSSIGAIIEFLQAIPFVHGDPGFKDWVADIIGVGLMLALLWGAKQIGVFPEARTARR